MAAVLAIALKDLKLLFRVKAAFFFTMVWPLLVAVIFGSLFGGGDRGPSRLAIAITDDDQTTASKAFVDGLAAREGFDVLRTTDAEARDLVRRGRRIGAVLVPKGFGAASQHLFYGESPKVELRDRSGAAGRDGDAPGLPARAGRQAHADDVRRSRPAARAWSPACSPTCRRRRPAASPGRRRCRTCSARSTPSWPSRSGPQAAAADARRRAGRRPPPAGSRSRSPCRASSASARARPMATRSRSRRACSGASSAA